MAAGLTLPESALAAFKRALADELKRVRDPLGAPGIVWTDGGLLPDQLHLEFAELLAAAGPWGQAFPEPLFDNIFRLAEQRVVGETHLKLQVQHLDGGPPIEAMAFRRPPLAASQNSPLRLVYRLDVNHYRERRTAQLVVEHLDWV